MEQGKYLVFVFFSVSFYPLIALLCFALLFFFFFRRLVNLTHRLLEFSFTNGNEIPFGTWKESSDDRARRISLENSNLFSFYFNIAKQALTKAPLFYLTPSFAFERLAPYTNDTSTTHVCEKQELSEEESNRVLQHCRQHGVTVTTLFAAAIFQAVWMEEPSHQQNLFGMFAKSTRKECEVNDEELSNFVSGQLVPLLLKHKADSLFDKAKAIKAMVDSENAKGRHECLAQAYLVGLIMP